MNRTKSSAAPELRLRIEDSHAELVRSFVRESALADDLSVTNAALLANDSFQLWRALCAEASGRHQARIHVMSSADAIQASFFVQGHDAFSKILASFAETAASGCQFSRREQGVDGWEIALSRQLGEAPATIMSRVEVQTAAVDGDIQIDKPVWDDAPAIARCFLEVYGHHYVHAEVFSPKRYWKQVESGALIPVIARNAAGGVIGHVALERAPGASIAERGEAVVLPAYRGQRLLERMTERLTQEAQTLGLDGVFAQPVTVHTFSQHNDARAGMAACALALGVRPEQAAPKGAPVPTAGQRQSLLLMFNFLRTPAARHIYAPTQYHEILRKIYQALGADLSFATPATELTGQSGVAIKMEKSGVGDIRFTKIGAGVAVELRQICSDLLDFGVKSLRLSAPLGDPGVPVLVDAARACGFFFSGVAPCFEDGADALLMQYLVEPLDIDKLQIYADQTKELAAFIAGDRIELADKNSGK